MHYPFSMAAPVGSINSSLRALGASLKVARMARGKSIKQQAGRAGLSPDAVERIERGANTATFAEVIALCISLRVQFQLQPTVASSTRIEAEADLNPLPVPPGKLDECRHAPGLCS